MPFTSPGLAPLLPPSCPDDYKVQYRGFWRCVLAFKQITGCAGEQFRHYGPAAGRLSELQQNAFIFLLAEWHSQWMHVNLAWTVTTVAVHPREYLPLQACIVCAEHSKLGLRSHSYLVGHINSHAWATYLDKVSAWKTSNMKPRYTYYSMWATNVITHRSREWQALCRDCYKVDIMRGDFNAS